MITTTNTNNCANKISQTCEDKTNETVSTATKDETYSFSKFILLHYQIFINIMNHILDYKCYKVGCETASGFHIALKKSVWSSGTCVCFDILCSNCKEVRVPNVQTSPWIMHDSDKGIVFDMNKPGNLHAIVNGEAAGTLIK